MNWVRTVLGAAVGAVVTAAAFVSPASAQGSKVQVALGDTISVETLAYLVALERAKERGVDYDLTSFAKEDLAIQAVVNGQADLGIGTPYSVAQKSKAPLRGLFQVTRLVFFAVADKSYKTWKDLDGQSMTFHARGTGTEAIGNILADKHGIKFGQRNYVAGLGEPGRRHDERPDQGHHPRPPQQEPPACPRRRTASTSCRGSTRRPARGSCSSARIGSRRMPTRPTSSSRNSPSSGRKWPRIPPSSSRRGRNPACLKDLPKELLSDVTKFYTEAVESGVFDKNGGHPEAVKADFTFYTQAGQMTGSAGDLKVEDFWTFGPLERARKKIGS